MTFFHFSTKRTPQSSAHMSPSLCELPQSALVLPVCSCSTMLMHTSIRAGIIVLKAGSCLSGPGISWPGRKTEYLGSG